MTKRKIHIDLSESIHKRLRVKSALQDVSIQKFVEKLIADAVTDIQLEELVSEAEKKELIGSHKAIGKMPTLEEKGRQQIDVLLEATG